MISVRVTRNSFPALEKAMPQRIGRVNEIAAKDLKEEAQGESPVDSGRMRDEHEAVKLAAFTWAVIVPTPYAHFVHDGTSRQSPNPWLLRAARRIQGAWLDALDKALKDVGP